MIRFVHSKPRFEKRLKNLQKSEKFAVAAAMKADKIIDNLVCKGNRSIIETGRLSRYGEARIPNCIKYDLGKGYRLVCVRQREHFFLLYIGTHDDCRRWIENNRGLIPDIHQRNTKTRFILNSPVTQGDETKDPEKDIDYEDLLMARITEKDLRWVFRGLCGNKSLA
jgi:hypothetical protein